MRIEPIAGHHNRLAFTCGDETLDRYLHETAQHAVRKGLAVTFVATDPSTDPSRVLGYYALSNFLVNGIEIPDAARKRRKLPTHAVPATLLGRLAVDQHARGRGVGKRLLGDALKRAYRVSAHVGSTAVIVHALNPEAVAFYTHFGFEPVRKDDLRLFLMMDTIAQIFPDGNSTESRTGVSAAETAGRT